MYGSTSTISEGERMVLTVGGILGLGAALGSAGLFWQRGMAYLVRHQVLAAAGGSSTLVRIPGAGGGGLDLPRLLIVLGVTIAMLACVGSVLYRHAVRRAAE